ncbi:hypothetical protein E2562_004987 [Oryza meyeriana var. granulata]|uniref:Uncharacterized protein n=1 Tax=Oryza meyeriana var. granulata TaxID=110450 RepID=A0A6G1C493_9ORYZ|nr:hypothetical protein E2562_004987 [Oryza meyeriana var. granulata]
MTLVAPHLQPSAFDLPCSNLVVCVTGATCVLDIPNITHVACYGASSTYHGTSGAEGCARP